MSLSSSTQGAIAVNHVPETLTDQIADRGADAALTARAMVVVTFTGAGIWYLLWKVALLFVAGH